MTLRSLTKVSVTWGAPQSYDKGEVHCAMVLFKKYTLIKTLCVTYVPDSGSEEFIIDEEISNSGLIFLLIKLRN